MTVVLLAVVMGLLGFAVGSMYRRSSDALLRAALLALDAAERDVAHWRQLARYWQRRSEHAEGGVTGDDREMSPALPDDVWP